MLAQRQRPTLDDGGVMGGVVGGVAPNKSWSRATDADLGEVLVNWWPSITLLSRHSRAMFCHC